MTRNRIHLSAGDPPLEEEEKKQGSVRTAAASLGNISTGLTRRRQFLLGSSGKPAGGAVEQKYLSAKMRFCTQSSAATFAVEIKSIFLLLAFGASMSLPITTGAKDSLELFYCNFAGCAANVVKVFCNDTLLQHDLLPDCSGSPLPHKVCQHDGRAYVSTPVGTKCEFEEESKYISTEKCTDVDPICLWVHATSSPTPSNNGKKAAGVHPGYIVLGCILALLVGGVICYCVKRRS